LLPFTSKTSLKVLHMRVPVKDLNRDGWWTLHPIQATSDMRSEAPLNDVVFRGSEVLRGRMLEDEFCRFADWVFGPQGVTSLHVLACGDFSYGTSNTSNLILCRNTEGSGNFQLLWDDSPIWSEVFDEYRNELESCPLTQLLAEEFDLRG
jgi:hypothetical protein